ncbi:EamA family transporter [Geomonas subterranea]|uniref:DMT family transporter n=1 Tax=Geomonas subterranea TaxID=2847989 RepID=A0ABX8LK48_9BACT|nr:MULTISPECIES: EamA family transporter [Geomonas]QXE92098.1 DMT family transporter [Geomonas subterranea]QXM09807.1 DMT family transporter [Geomonas subterranea]
MLSVLFGLATAFCWGTCDFIGGTSSRRTGAFFMTLATIASGLAMLIPVALMVRETPPTAAGWALNMIAGGFDALGILLLYRSMKLGRLSLAAPLSALTAATIPVIVGMATQGVPDRKVVLGLALVLASVWLLCREQSEGPAEPLRPVHVWLPLLSGSCLGLFLVLMHSASSGAVLWPMVAVRCGGVLVLLLFLAAGRQGGGDWGALPWRMVLLNAFLDVCGNGFYIMAGHSGRMDVAAVLSSLFPGATVFLAWLILKERVSMVQLGGVATALAAIALLT